MNAETKEGTTTDTGRVVERELEIDAPVSTVWEALTKAEELRRWFPLEASVKPGEGGAIHMKWGDLYDAESKIAIWEPNKHLRTEFPNTAAVRLWTDYHLEGRGGKTFLRVVTSGFGEGQPWDDLYHGVFYGWRYELQSLRHYVERHLGKNRHIAWVRKSYKGDSASAWNLMMRVIGLGDRLDLEVGTPYATETPTGDQLSGGVLIWERPRQFVGTVDSWSNALLRVETKGNEREGSAQIWLAAYGVNEDEVLSLEGRWQESVNAIFAI